MVTQGILSVISSPVCLSLICAGVFIGIIFGSIPGLSAVMAVCLFLPLSFGMSTINGVSLLLGLYIGGISGGLISAILLKIPGTPASVATVFDGGPMAERGDAGKAIGMGILYSFIGGVLSLIALIYLSPKLAKFALKFTSVEYAAVTLFSLTVIASLSGKRPILGIISGLIGVLLSCAGDAPVDGITRFNFGSHLLDPGFSNVPLMIGFYAVSDVFRFAQNYHEEMKKPQVKTARIKGYGVTIKEFIKSVPVMIQSTLIGLGIGILPGIGGGTACMVSYSAAQTVSKEPEKFGTGCNEGLIASETANNATTGGSMVPMLTLGIPGSSTAAMLMSGLIIHGVTPGPLIFRTNGSLMFGIFTAMLVANVAMLIMERAALPVFTKLLSIPKHFLLPCVVVMCALGCYTTNHVVFDVMCMWFFGIVGLLFRKIGMPLSPCIIGFILGGSFEKYLRRSLISKGGSLLPFVQSPISVFFLVMALVFCVVPMIRSRKRKAA